MVEPFTPFTKTIYCDKKQKPKQVFVFISNHHFLKNRVSTWIAVFGKDRNNSDNFSR